MATKKSSKVVELEDIIRNQHLRLDGCISTFIAISTIAENLYENMYEIDEMQMSALLHALKSMADQGMDNAI